MGVDRPEASSSPPPLPLLGLFWFGYLVDLDVVCGYNLLFLLDIKTEIGKKGCLMLGTGDHLFGKWLFTWLSLVMSLVVSYFVLSLFRRDVLNEIWD